MLKRRHKATDVEKHPFKYSNICEPFTSIQSNVRYTMLTTMGILIKITSESIFTDGNITMQMNESTWKIENG